MADNEFTQVLENFQAADVKGKVDIYVHTPNLTREQYTQLLRSFPLSELDKLEAALG